MRFWPTIYRKRNPIKMNKTKEQLEQLILQEYKSYFTEQQTDPKAALKVNASQQIRMLRFMKEVLKKVTISPEVEKMAEQLKKAKTAEFLTQVLGVDQSIPINLSSALESPVALIQAVIDEVISVAINKARQKLAENLQEGEALDEGDLPFLAVSSWRFRLTASRYVTSNPRPTRWAMEPSMGRQQELIFTLPPPVSRAALMTAA